VEEAVVEMEIVAIKVEVIMVIKMGLIAGIKGKMIMEGMTIVAAIIIAIVTVATTIAAATITITTTTTTTITITITMG
jgi:cytochrome c oxidase subunit IV